MTSELEYTFEKVKMLFGLSSYPIVEVKSTIDGKMYRVRDMPDKQKAADLMAQIRLNMQKLKLHLESTYPDKAQVKQLSKNFRADAKSMFESTPDADYTSYSVNKGEAVHFCLRQRNDENHEKLVDLDVMTFVAIHEMAHMITKTIGHGPDFWNNFGWLLREAETRNLYRPTDFKSQPVTYCGVQITDSPKYDPTRDNEKSGTDFSFGKIFS